MRRLHVPTLVACCAALAALLGACGKGGSDGGDAPPPPDDRTPVPPDPFSLRTTVGLDAMGYELRGLTACLTRDAAPALAEVGPTLAVDGDLGDWTAVT